MTDVDPNASADFSVGELIRHKRFEYRGVVVDVDPTFQLSDDWYDQVARSRPPKDAPWYHVLVDGSDQMTYVAQRNLERDTSAEPIHHPLLGDYFEGFDGGRYVSAATMN
jgi:heat shock protein HspQ